MELGNTGAACAFVQTIFVFVKEGDGATD